MAKRRALTLSTRACLHSDMCEYEVKVRALALNGVFDILREHGKQVFDEELAKLVKPLLCGGYVAHGVQWGGAPSNALRRFGRGH